MLKAFLLFLAMLCPSSLWCLPPTYFVIVVDDAGALDEKAMDQITEVSEEFLAGKRKGETLKLPSGLSDMNLNFSVVEVDAKISAIDHDSDGRFRLVTVEDAEKTKLILRYPSPEKHSTILAWFNNPGEFQKDGEGVMFLINSGSAFLDQSFKPSENWLQTRLLTKFPLLGQAPTDPIKILYIQTVDYDD